VALALDKGTPPAGVLPRHRALLAAWLSREAPAAVAGASTRLHLDRATTVLVGGLATARATVWTALQQPDLPPSQVAALLQPYPPALRWLLYTLHSDPVARHWLERYEATLAAVRPLLTGTDLLALGVPRGPAMRDILAALRAARLDGQITTHADEEQFVRAWLERAASSE
jgi:hypothetical protein